MPGQAWKPGSEAMDAYFEARAAAKADIAKAQSLAESRVRHALIELRESAGVPPGIPVQFDGSRFVEDLEAQKE